MDTGTILVPLDGSALAETAVPTAIELARAEEARLHLVRAAEVAVSPMTEATEAQLLAVNDAEDCLTAIAFRLRDDRLSVTTSAWYGPAERSWHEGGL